LNLEFLQTSLIAKAAGRDLHKICPFSSSHRNCVLSSLIQNNTILQVERASEDDLVSLLNQPQDFPNFAEIWNHPKKAEILFRLAVGAGSDPLINHLL